MRIAVAILSLLVVALMLTEFFVTFLLPRRVKRDPRIARRFFTWFWTPWRAIAARLSPVAGDTMLGIYGPLGLVLILVALSVGLIIGYSGLHWAADTHLGGAHAASFLQDLYFSAGSFFSVSVTVSPKGVGKLIQVVEAASGFGVLAISIGYLPALFQAFSEREKAVSQLDARAGSPPTAGGLLVRSGERAGWGELDAYLQEWEGWAAELMETHLSYPAIGYFRSQHVNQNWLAALTAVVDSCAFAIAFAPEGEVLAAELTFAIGRHALADLAYAYRAPVKASHADRLPDGDLDELCSRLEGSGLALADGDEARSRLRELRASYERYTIAIAAQLALPLAGWLPSEDVIENWRRASAKRRRPTLP
ncbi:MAG: two pore domain potassium channel family protein [Solirubrobacterales bacterium]|nr:MAG: two pore domain potassium channel family protein [Solirubrobacterales bacterium]